MDWQEFWGPIHRQGETFWSTLGPLPWFDALVKHIKETTDDWHIVSSPSPCETSYLGKIRWLRDRLGIQFDKFHLTFDKHLFANNRTVLIDDREENLAKFGKSGGYVILFPSRGNNAHGVAANGSPLEAVIAQLKVVSKFM